MALQPGSRVGPYEIVTRIGAGGMGEVFRAKDTRLGRTVAVKALPAHFSDSAPLRQRFQREARAISSLTHPHICALYDVGEENGVDFLVMEYLEGETLFDRLSKGALPLEDALRHAIEICAALEVAHREGVIHRDLKPGNVILTKSGAKLLDFGLARTADDAEPPVTADAPTMHAPKKQSGPLTAEGTIIGTFQYMAPEQLEGMPADARTDIFAFGCLLYEMLTGRRAFDGKTRTSIIAAIVAGTPQPVSALRPVAPASLDHVVQRCLDKDPDARWQSAHDVRLELEWIARQVASPQAATRRASPKLPWIAAALATMIALAAGVLAWRSLRAPSGARAVRAQILAPHGNDFGYLMTSMSISPDARFITYRVSGDERLWLRDVGTGEARPLEGTDDAQLPFWSPDSSSIAFFSGEKLKKIAMRGTPPVTLCDAPKGRSGDWSRDGVVLFSPAAQSGIWRISDQGGQPVEVTKVDAKLNETTHRWPSFLPDGQHFLYLAGTHKGQANRDLDAVYVTSLDEPSQRTLLLRTRSQVVYADGHLLYEKNGVLLAHPFDPDALRFTGEPVALAQAVYADASLFRAAFSAAHDGTVIYHERRSVDALRFAVHENGAMRDVLRPKQQVIDLVPSPDGRKAILRVLDATGLADLWQIDIDRATFTRITATPTDNEWNAIWYPDGKRLLIGKSEAFGGGGVDLVVRNLEGDTAPRPMLTVDNRKLSPIPTAVSRDGTTALLTMSRSDMDVPPTDVMSLALTGSAQPRPVIATDARECCAVFSPDMKWIAYASDESGRVEVYVARYPDGGAKTQVTFEGASYIQWPAMNELLVADRNSFLRVPLTVSGDVVRAAPPQRIFTDPPGTVFSDTADGKRFMILAEDRNEYAQTITLVTGWKM